MSQSIMGIPRPPTENHRPFYHYKWRRSLLGVGNKPGADVGTDHHLTVATLRLKIGGNQKEARRFDVNMLRDDNVREHVSIHLQNKFEALADL